MRGGRVDVNDTIELQAPFGGCKLSGFGRELGREGLTAYRETKHIKMRAQALTAFQGFGGGSVVSWATIRFG